ncbi:uncharacterized protein [Euwallacea similis]|uniref:uncharacterized protein n=1 Tax=Euwallacea similis TaxID=1736056 RepID=UPI00344D786B
MEENHSSNSPVQHIFGDSDTDDNGPHEETISIVVEAHVKPNTIYHCTVCMYQTYWRRKLKEHFFRCCKNRHKHRVHKKPLVKDGATFKCEYCIYSCTDLTSLLQHKEIHEEDINQGIIECSQCSWTFFTMNECMTHMETVCMPGKKSSGLVATADKSDCIDQDNEKEIEVKNEAPDFNAQNLSMDLDESQKTDKNYIKWDQCPDCEFRARSSHGLEKHRDHVHSDFWCGECKFCIKGTFQFFCHNYFIHGKVRNLYHWVLICRLCPYKGTIRSSYEHGKEHETSEVTFHVRNHGNVFGNTTFYYSSKDQTIWDALPKNVIGTCDISSIKLKNGGETEDEIFKRIESFFCSGCRFVTKNVMYLKAHQNLCQKKSKDQKISCHEKDCSYSSNEKANFKRHLRTIHKYDMQDILVVSKINDCYVEELFNGSKGDEPNFNEKNIEATPSEIAKNSDNSEKLNNDLNETGSSLLSPEVLVAKMFANLEEKSLACCAGSCLYEAKDGNSLREHLMAVHCIEGKPAVEGACGTAANQKGVGNVNSSIEKIKKAQVEDLAQKGQLNCPIQYCSYESKDKNALREHLIEVHGIIGKASLEKELKEAENRRKEFISPECRQLETYSSFTCSICDMNLQGKFQLFCHNYVLHGATSDLENWLLQCMQCPFKGPLKDSYDHGKEQHESPVDFNTIYRENTVGSVTFHYSGTKDQTILNAISDVPKEVSKNPTPEKEDSLKCDDCSFETFDSTFMKAHQMSFHWSWKGKVLRQCPEKDCEFISQYKGGFKRHLINVHNYDFDGIYYRGDPSSSVAMVCPTRFCLYEGQNRTELREHLIEVHGIVGKTAIQRLLSKIASSEKIALNHMKKDGETPGCVRFFCTLCYYDTDEQPRAVKHGWKHWFRVLSFYKYENKELKGLMQVTYPETQCDLCDFRSRDVLDLYIHKHEKHLDRLTQRQKQNFEAKLLDMRLAEVDVRVCNVEQPDEAATQDEDLLCCSCCHFKTSTQFQMKVHQTLAHSQGQAQSFKCPEEFCLYICEQKDVFFKHLVKGHKYEELYFRDYGANAFNHLKLENDDDWGKPDELEINANQPQLIIQLERLSEQCLKNLMKAPEVDVESDLMMKINNGNNSDKKADREPPKKRLKVAAMSFKCWICGSILSNTISLQKHTNFHAEERNHLNLKARYTVYEESKLLKTITIQAKVES